MKKFVRAMIVLMLVIVCGCFITGCGQSADNKELDKILKNPENYPQLTTEEFLSIIDGKTKLTTDDLPKDKACYSADKFNFTRYIIDGRFIFSCYIHSRVAERNMYTLDYFENGEIVETISEIDEFADFIEKHRA